MSGGRLVQVMIEQKNAAFWFVLSKKQVDVFERGLMMLEAAVGVCYRFVRCDVRCIGSRLSLISTSKYWPVVFDRF